MQCGVVKAMVLGYYSIETLIHSQWLEQFPNSEIAKFSVGQQCLLVKWNSASCFSR